MGLIITFDTIRWREIVQINSLTKFYGWRLLKTWSQLIANLEARELEILLTFLWVSSGCSVFKIVSFFVLINLIVNLELVVHALWKKNHFVIYWLAMKVCWIIKRDHLIFLSFWVKVWITFNYMQSTFHCNNTLGKLNCLNTSQQITKCFSIFFLPVSYIKSCNEEIQQRILFKKGGHM